MEQLVDGKYIVNMRYFMRGDLLGNITIAEISQFIEPTVEEQFCYKWHRGMYDYMPDGREFFRAMGKYPAIYTLHCAEVFISYILENRRLEFGIVHR